MASASITIGLLWFVAVLMISCMLSMVSTAVPSPGPMRMLVACLISGVISGVSSVVRISSVRLWTIKFGE